MKQLEVLIIKNQTKQLIHTDELIMIWLKFNHVFQVILNIESV